MYSRLEEAKITIAKLYKDIPQQSNIPSLSGKTQAYYHKEINGLPPLKVYDEKGKHEAEKVREVKPAVAKENDFIIGGKIIK